MNPTRHGTRAKLRTSLLRVRDRVMGGKSSMLLIVSDRGGSPLFIPRYRPYNTDGCWNIISSLPPIVVLLAPSRSAVAVPRVDRFFPVQHLGRRPGSSRKDKHDREKAERERPPPRPQDGR